MSHREIGEVFGVSYFAVSKALRRAEQLRRNDRWVARIVLGLTTAFQD